MATKQPTCGHETVPSRVSIREAYSAGTMRERIAAQLRQIGVRAGDTLFIRASLRAIGHIEGDRGETVLGGFQDAVGHDGTLMAPAFTKIGNVFSKTKIVFDPKSSPPSSGAISTLFLNHPDVLRSNHPSHSFA